MKAIYNFENVQATTGEFSRPTSGGFICKITKAIDYPYDETTGKGDYLKIEYDIADGEFKDFYRDSWAKFGGDWWAKFFRSYKEKALGMFKHFTNCVESSNAGYKWDWNENGLVGKLIGLVIGEEEYETNDGIVKTRFYVKEIKTVQQIKDGDFKVPELKKLNNDPAPTYGSPSSNSGFQDLGDDEELPF